MMIIVFVIFLFYCFHKAGLEIGEMILAVNKDTLVGSNYEMVSKK